MAMKCKYTVYNNTSDDLKFFDMSDIATDLEGTVVVTIEAGENHEFFGYDFNFEKIQDNMKAKCFELGVPNNKQGVYLAISTILEEPEE